MAMMTIKMMTMMKRREKGKCLTAFVPGKNTDLLSFWPFLKKFPKLLVHFFKKLPSQIALEKGYHIDPSIDKLQDLKFGKAEFITH